MSQQWLNKNDKNQPIIKIPLQFQFEPVDVLSKQLTKLNSSSPYRILYLGPRWEDSAALHRKYANKEGYKFNDKQINKNSNFFSETMGQNQFYKNQVYYRAFEGVNPTIDKENQLQFNSRFQSGNLDCVVKVGPNQYDLFLRIDSNTQGHLFWYYFEISNGKPDNTIKLNICNLTKSIQLYQKGFKPFCSIRNNQGLFQNWTQDPCYQVDVRNRRLRYQFIYEKVKVRKLIQLSFKYKFESKQPVRFAYCIPYTYSQMLTQINQLAAGNPQFIKIGSIGRSITGLDIPFLMAGKDQNKNQSKNVVVCIGRLHPGETNGSHVLSGLMNYICTSNQAEYIRKKIITIFVPMINVDGVILGNSRTGAVGRDLNREFKTKNRFLFPQIFKLKQFCNTILETHQIQMFLDFHGHSRKKNMFFFGPNYNITQPQYYKSRVMPRFLSQITPIFRYFGCDYSIPASKSSTARAVMLQQINIPYVYAIQTSIGQYFDYDSHKIVPFNLKKWKQLGNDTGKALKLYFQSIQQFAQFVKSKSSTVNQANLEAKSGVSQSKNSKIPPLRQPSSPDKQKKTTVKDKDVRLMKVFQQIKAMQQQRKVTKKKLEQSDNQSDSSNEEDNLQGKKRTQFQHMVVEFISTQNTRKQKQQEYQQKPLSKKKKQKKSKKQLRKRQKLFQKQQLTMMNQMLRNFSGGYSTQTQKNQIIKSGNKLKCKKLHKNQQFFRSQQNYNISSIVQQNKNCETKYENLIANHRYFDDVFPQNTAQKNKKNQINLRMFNFSKMIEQVQVRNASTSGKKGRNKYLVSLRQINTLDSDADTQNFKLSNTVNKISLDQGIKNQQFDQGIDKQTMTNTSSKKMKGLFPASFYRIKYQNYQRKKQQKCIQEIKQDDTKFDQQYQQIKTYKKKEGLFLNIKKVSNC